MYTKIKEYASWIESNTNVFQGVYKIINKRSGLALDVYRAGVEPRTPVIQWTFDPNTSNQFWKIESISNGNYKIIAQHSGQALDINKTSTVPGAQVIQWPFDPNTSNQFWKIESVGGGAYKLIVQHSGQALEVGAARLDEGAPVNQWPYVGGDNQQWYLHRIDGPSIPITSEASISGAKNSPLSSNILNEKDSKLRTLELYPNPSNSFISLSLSDRANIESFQITDIRGATIIKETEHRLQDIRIDVSHVSSGIYIAIVDDGIRKYYKKFIKQ